MATAYTAPAGCPDEAAFFREVVARTRRVRARRSDENARVLEVVVGQVPDGFVGSLVIEDATTRSRVREVAGATCAEVVEALALVAALAVDPKASTTSRASSPAPPEPPPPEMPDAAAPSSEPPPPLQPRDAAHDAPGHTLARPTTNASRLRYALGAQVEAAALAGLVPSGRLFGELELGDRATPFVPSMRLVAARSLDTDRTPAIGQVSLRWTQASLEGCPLRIALVSTTAFRPCAGFAAGLLDAGSAGIDAARSRSRAWVTGSVSGRATWEPTPMLAIELELGALVPFHRETFFFEPGTPVYRAPVIALAGRAGMSVRFP